MMFIPGKMSVTTTPSRTQGTSRTSYGTAPKWQEIEQNCQQKVQIYHEFIHSSKEVHRSMIQAQAEYLGHKRPRYFVEDRLAPWPDTSSNPSITKQIKQTNENRSIQLITGCLQST